MAKNKLPTADVTEDPHYHDTWTLLRKYRDVVWSLEVSVRQVRNRFRIDYGKTIEDFLESVYLAGVDFADTGIQEHARSIERSYKMLKLMENAVNLLRSKHKFGETYYWVLYYSYLSPSSTKTQRRSSSSFSRIFRTSAIAPIFASGRKPSKLFRQSFGAILPETA